MARFAAEMARRAAGKIVLYRARSRDGREFYAYIRCSERQYHAMKRDFKTDTPCGDAAAYGEVLYLASGTEPDEAARAFLASLP